MSTIAANGILYRTSTMYSHSHHERFSEYVYLINVWPSHRTLNHSLCCNPAGCLWWPWGRTDDLGSHRENPRPPLHILAEVQLTSHSSIARSVGIFQVWSTSVSTCSLQIHYVPLHTQPQLQIPFCLHNLCIYRCWTKMSLHNKIQRLVSICGEAKS